MFLSVPRLLLALGFAAVAANAAPTTGSNSDAAPLAKREDHLIQTEKDSDPFWVTDAEELELIKTDTHFIDVTDSYEEEAEQPKILEKPTGYKGKLYYPALAMQHTVKPLLEQVSIPNMQAYLGNLTSFYNRYYTSESGAASAQWIYDTVSALTKAYPESGAEAHFFQHKFLQKSIVVTIPGTEQGPVTVLGSHQDSINAEDPKLAAPGADDDGTGTVNLIEALRILLSNGFKPVTPVHLHWYAGEEEGLLGSMDIARYYRKAGVQITGMMQLDMTAYVKPGTVGVISLVPDFTNADLNDYIATLVEEYSAIEWDMSEPCGYGCSDHAAWDRYGYPTAFPMEGSLPETTNPYIHTTADTTDLPGFDWNHMAEFTKLAIAFAVELSSTQ